MPYTIRKVRNKNCYSVRTTKSKRVMAKCSTKENAKKQTPPQIMSVSFKVLKFPILVDNFENK